MGVSSSYSLADAARSSVELGSRAEDRQTDDPAITHCVRSWIRQLGLGVTYLHRCNIPRLD